METRLLERNGQYISPYCRSIVKSFIKIFLVPILFMIFPTFAEAYDMDKRTLERAVASNQSLLKKFDVEIKYLTQLPEGPEVLKKKSNVQNKIAVVKNEIDRLSRLATQYERPVDISMNTKAPQKNQEWLFTAEKSLVWHKGES